MYEQELRLREYVAKHRNGIPDECKAALFVIGFLALTFAFAIGMDSLATYLEAIAEHMPKQ